jgi:rSAM/selenodomain-associated transferase 2
MRAEDRISVIVPVLDEARIIAAALDALRELRDAGHEIIVVDGGSRDGTAERAADLGASVVRAPRGRASQMNAGSREASGGVLLFLHADTRLPAGAAGLVAAGLGRTGRAWGRFDVRISARSPALAVVALMMNLRSRLTGIATGDQAIFVRRAAFEAAGGFPDIALMEDIALSARLRRVSRPLCVRARVTTSGRRWEKHGVGRTILLMWWLRLRFFLGASPEALARRYEGQR